MASTKERIELYDTTLRDGTQGHSVSLSLQDKLLIARRLDELGVDYIEGGYPLSNAKDIAFFKEVAAMSLKHARPVAFGMTRRKNTRTAADEGMKALLGARTPTVCIVGKSWDLHVRDVLQVSEQENLDMIAESVAFCVRRGREVIYDAEHFFDGYAANPHYALRTLLAAQDAGASCITLCDTNGGSLPDLVAVILTAVRPSLKVRIGIHTHNDSGLAVANALAAVRHGATLVQGTINGIGERCGNADLTTVAANLALKMDRQVLTLEGLARLTEVSRYVYEVANLIPEDRQPYVGQAAFAHKGGMHVHAVRRIAHSYEHVKPEAIGNSRRILISELSGASGVAVKIGNKLDIAHDKTLQRRLIKRLQECEEQGYVFESAEASFELLCRRELGLYHPFWEFGHWRVVALRSANDDEPNTEAILKLKVTDGFEHHVSPGHGPVDAMANAFLKALTPHYPDVAHVRLIDYKVRVINPRAATAAKVRVTIEFLDDQTHEIYGTVGVSENIIEASWQALVDGFEYKLINDEDWARKARPAKAARPSRARKPK
ncbi:MAG TPA: citramalate synthase [Phycisphaerae bacterium]|nr:citramalate synthase [Phycisphaerae bacterium]